MTASCRSGTSRGSIVPEGLQGRVMRRALVAPALDQLDAVAVGVAHEAQPRAALADAVGRLLGLDALLGEPRQRRVEVAGRDRDVVVAGAELVAVDPVVVRQLEA